MLFMGLLNYRIEIEAELRLHGELCVGLEASLLIFISKSGIAERPVDRMGDHMDIPK
jgi:hypothetical protein